MIIRLIRLLISCAVLCRDYLVRLTERSEFPGTCVVINYHALAEENIDQFARQLDTLLKLAEPIFISSMETLEQGERYVSVTFDDAFRSFKRWALPELTRRQIPALIFAPTGYLGQRSTWFDYGGDNPVGEDVMSKDELKEVATSEFVEIGSHSVHHVNLAELSLDEARLELEESKKDLQMLLGKEIKSFSFPYGSFTEREVGLARAAGYTHLFSIAPQLLVAKTQGGLVGRVNVQPTDWPIEFRLKVLGAYRWLPLAAAWKRQLKKRMAFEQRR